MVKTPSTSVPPKPQSVPATSETISLQAFSEDEETLFEELRICLAVARAKFGSVRDIEFTLLLRGHVPRSKLTVSMGGANERSKHYRNAIENDS